MEIGKELKEYTVRPEPLVPLPVPVEPTPTPQPVPHAPSPAREPLVPA
jgi:hypothetical protein